MCSSDLIIIDPKMAFGTGNHETTFLMISEILKLDLTSKELLDMGCGTAVLATHTGKVLQVSPSENKVIVEGQNMVTKHVKPRRQGEQGGIVKAEGAMYASKVMPICPKCGKAVRVGHVEKDGKMVRVCKKCGAEL